MLRILAKLYSMCLYHPLKGPGYNKGDMQTDCKGGHFMRRHHTPNPHWPKIFPSFKCHGGHHGIIPSSQCKVYNYWGSNR